MQPGAVPPGAVSPAFVPPGVVPPAADAPTAWSRYLICKFVLFVSLSFISERTCLSIDFFTHILQK
jgi:hypothetical protein